MCNRALKGMQLGREGLRGREIIIEPFKFTSTGRRGAHLFRYKLQSHGCLSLQIIELGSNILADDCSNILAEDSSNILADDCSNILADDCSNILADDFVIY
ncbi:hypothetical protein DPMN_137011 [Dreissena polymorpha]|uniref:Uncharacterized protein n=1 Tax=Dreissena polymorpha TaxID=45954 RepID=A0A9D4JG28_DREPO|nr:hypothetical protein DPMN_137011 [Dreissena polymorpha]